MRADYIYTDEPNPHSVRARAILKKYPQVKDLMGPYPLGFLYICLIVLLQFGVAALVSAESWWWVLGSAYLIGALCTHALFAMIHEASHDVVLHGRSANLWAGIVCNMGQGLPSYVGFRKFHLLHHSNLNEYDYDADLAFHLEAKWVGDSTWKKILWYLGFIIIEAVRPLKLKKRDLNDKWTYINVAVILLSNGLLWYFFGFKAVAYLMLSTVFGIGLHPVGARWIQEHYTFKDGQETYSYYGPLNKLAFNIGYHNEHHDLFKIAWINLPKLKKIAPEFYEPLYAHKSWTKLLLTFLFTDRICLYHRIVRRPGAERKPATGSTYGIPESALIQDHKESSHHAHQLPQS